MSRRQCAYCGTFVGEDVKRCPSCREEIAERIEIRRDPKGGPEIRRGLIFMLLGLALYYLASPGSPVTIPFQIPPMVTTYLLPALFLLGLGVAILGAMRRVGMF